MHLIDILLLAIVGLVTWCIASEGAWSAALMCIIVLFSGILAMNYFEPMAEVLESSVSSSGTWKYWWDITALVGLFAIFVFAFRKGCEYLLPDFIEVHPLAHEIVRWSAGGLTGVITMSFLLTALHTAPLPRDFFGFEPERKNFFGVSAPDRAWLGYIQFISEKSLRKGRSAGFDSAELKIGDFEGTWSTFPIKYASRRDELAGGASQTTSRKRGRAIRKSAPSSTPSGGNRKPNNGRRSKSNVNF